MLPLTLEHRQLTTGGDETDTRTFDRTANLLSILCKHRVIVNRLYHNQVGFHLTLLRANQFAAQPLPR
jgi:hypothetical protein